MIKQFSDLEIIERLDETHQGNTSILLTKADDVFMVCKAIQKTSLKDSKSIEHVNNQKQALLYFTQKKHQRINNIISTFQDADKLYMLLEVVEGLPLHKLLQMVGKFNQHFTRLISIQVALILKDFHSEGFIYRDIKASNFMVDSKGRVTMIDLGHAKQIGRDKTFTICGTTHSMPPEIYNQKGYSFQFDYYSFGILIAELITGKAPFGYENTNPNLLADMKNGLQESHLVGQGCLSEQVSDIIWRLLAEPGVRLGSKNGFEEILEHEFFNVPEFLLAKDIYDEVEQLDPHDERFELYISEIVDFGVEKNKYEEISPNDPFYKFYG